MGSKNAGGDTPEGVKKTRNRIPRTFYIVYNDENGARVNAGPFGNAEFALGYIKGVTDLNPMHFGPDGAQVVELAERVYKPNG